MLGLSLLLIYTVVQVLLGGSNLSWSLIAYPTTLLFYWHLFFGVVATGIGVFLTFAARQMGPFRALFLFGAILHSALGIGGAWLIYSAANAPSEVSPVGFVMGVMLIALTRYTSFEGKTSEGTSFSFNRKRTSYKSVPHKEKKPELAAPKPIIIKNPPVPLLQPTRKGDVCTCSYCNTQTRILQDVAMENCRGCGASLLLNVA